MDRLDPTSASSSARARCLTHASQAARAVQARRPSQAERRAVVDVHGPRRRTSPRRAGAACRGAPAAPRRTPCRAARAATCRRRRTTKSKRVGVERQPADGLGGVDVGQAAVARGGRRERVEAAGHDAGRRPIARRSPPRDRRRARSRRRGRPAAPSRTMTPRSACARNGKSTDVKSSSAPSTRAPSGSAAAMSAPNVDTWLPMATRAGVRADEPGEPLARARRSARRRRPLRRGPVRQVSMRRLRARRAARRGGSPMLAVLT